jgi:hypothetical protein
MAATLVAAPRPAAAAEVEVTAVLARAQVEVGQQVYLQVEVETDGGSIGQPQLSGLDDFDVSSRGTSSGMSVQIGGGGRVQRSTKTFTYALSPRKPGEFVIGVEVEVDGELRRASSKPKLKVSGSAAAAPTETETETETELHAGKAGDLPTSPDAEVIVWPVVDKAEVFIGEQVVYELQIWERTSGNLSITSAPTFKDFWSENLQVDNARRNAERKLLGNVPYRVHSTIRRALFPQKAGTLVIGGPRVEAQHFGLFGPGGPPRSFAGRNLAIEVKPLPAAGQPRGFRPSNVGRFEIAADVDRTTLRQGEAVRLSVRIAGTGNIALVELPSLPELEGLRSYEPKPRTPQLELGKAELSGSRIYTLLLVADQAGELTIPAIELAYFDPKTQRYEVAASKPIHLQVDADPNAEPSPVAPAADGNGETELLVPPIAGGELVRVTPREPWLTRERWWVGALSVPAVLGLGWAGGALLRRFGPDDLARERARDLARRRMLLSEASAAVDGGEGFYPKLAALLQAAAIGRAGPEGVGLTRERLIALLAERGAAQQELDELRELLDACDAARFGAGRGDTEQRREHLERARTLLRGAAWSIPRGGSDTRGVAR